MNYIAITGALFGMGQDKSRPHFPANLVGDFGGGSTYLVIGILAALLESRLSGEGQVVDAAIVDGTANLNAMGSGYARRRQPARGARGQPARRRHAVLRPLRDLRRQAHVGGPLEPQFYEEFVKLLGIESAPDRYDFERLDELRRLITEAFAARTQAEWSEVFEGTDACVAPILTLSEATEHPHMAAREVFVEHEGVRQPAPAPRFSRTTASLSSPRPTRPASTPGRRSRSGGSKDVDDLIEKGVAVQA